jgi:hypothetical protein
MAARTYPDTPAGRLDAFCDEYMTEFRSKGHRVTRRRQGDLRKGTACYEVQCRKCGGVLMIGENSTRTVRDTPRMSLYGRVWQCR